jgi:hypothetical protein
MTTFTNRISAVHWLSHAGTKDSSAIIARDFVSAYDTYSLNKIDTWLPQSQSLEQIARQIIGDSGIDNVFNMISHSIQNNLYHGIEQYFARMEETDPDFDSIGANAGIALEVMDEIKRDIAWAAVEILINQPKFFTSLLIWYERGRWPCAWKGNYPQGCIVVV